MSEALYSETGSLRFWNEREVNLRDNFISQISLEVKELLLSANRGFSFHRVEGPILIPRSYISENYTDNDVFVTNHNYGECEAVLRAETTPASYQYARNLMRKGKRFSPPICVWQSGKSFRREVLDGASPSKLRFNEFYQLEFQCIYSETTMADYRDMTINKIADLLSSLSNSEVRIQDSKPPSYAESTKDIELMFNGKWMEVASCSIRTDFSEDMKVYEIAIGLDRLLEINSYFFEK